MVVFTDGGCSGNGSRDVAARRMISVVTDQDGRVLSEHFAEGGSNNIAELLAVRDAVVYCVRAGLAIVEVRTDSRNNFAWVFGARVGRGVNDRARVLALQGEIRTLRESVRMTLCWVPRDDNAAGRYLEQNHRL